MSLTQNVSGYASRTRHKKKKRELAMALDPNNMNDQLFLTKTLTNSENMSDCVYKGEREKEFTTNWKIPLGTSALLSGYTLVGRADRSHS